MDITEIDKNLKSTSITETDIVWRNVREGFFSIHGIFYSEEEKHYRRMMKEVADAVSEGVRVLSTCATGGRIRFRTDSPYVAVKAVLADMPAAMITQKRSQTIMLKQICVFPVPTRLQPRLRKYLALKPKTF